MSRLVRHAIEASPAARRLARELGVELGAVNGSGPGGRVGAQQKVDPETAAQGSDPAPCDSQGVAPTGIGIITSLRRMNQGVHGGL